MRGSLGTNPLGDGDAKKFAGRDQLKPVGHPVVRRTLARIGRIDCRIDRSLELPVEPGA
jgi:hypothetical protein